MLLTDDMTCPLQTQAAAPLELSTRAVMYFDQVVSIPKVRTSETFATQQIA
jgi:hypothetical protein